MLVWIGAAALVAVLAIVVRWAVQQRDARRWRRRDVPFPKLRTGTLGVVIAVAVVPTVLREHAENRFARVASALVGAPVTVHCQTLGEAFTDAGGELGYVRWGPDGVPEHHTVIKHDQCHDLSAYVSAHGRDPSIDEVVAVHVLTHESMHMRGITSESEAECAAVQRDTRTAMLLGASLADAHHLAVRYWNTIYPSMPSAYTTPDCAPGGRLDEHLPYAPWNSLGAAPA